MSVIEAIDLTTKRTLLSNGQTGDAHYIAGEFREDDEMTEIIIEKRSISRMIIED
jgi:hypothetical protein